MSLRQEDIYLRPHRESSSMSGFEPQASRYVDLSLPLAVASSRLKGKDCSKLTTMNSPQV